MGKELGGGEGGGEWGKGLFGGLLRNYLSGLRDNKALILTEIKLIRFESFLFRFIHSWFIFTIISLSLF